MHNSRNLNSYLPQGNRIIGKVEKSSKAEKKGSILSRKLAIKHMSSLHGKLIST